MLKRAVSIGVWRIGQCFSEENIGRHRWVNVYPLLAKRNARWLATVKQRQGSDEAMVIR
jgi:hypothetical protein